VGAFAPHEHPVGADQLADNSAKRNSVDLVEMQVIVPEFERTEAVPA
jgi:hypothetical protein